MFSLYKLSIYPTAGVSVDWLCSLAHFLRIGTLEAIRRLSEENLRIYGPKKISHQLNRESIAIVRCTVARLMGEIDLKRVGSRRRAKTTQTVPCEARTTSRVNRVILAERPNELWVLDLTYAATWRGFAYVAFLIDVDARRIMGWRASNSLRTDLALDAIEQALYDGVGTGTRSGPP